MSDPIKLRIDLSTGMVEIEASSGSIETVFKQLNEFLPRLTSAQSAARVSVDEIGETPAGDVAPASERTQKKQSNKGSSRTKETYRVIDLGLDENDRAKLRAYYQQKAPASQNEQTAVLMDWLKREKGKTTLGREAIFTAFRTVDAKAPGKISSVLGNMAGSSVGWVVGRGSGEYELTHVAEDYVRMSLPASKKKKEK